MRTFVVVKADVLIQIVVSLLRADIFMQINFFVLDGAPQSFCEDIFPGASPTIHADLNLGSEQTLKILWAGEVATLIAVPNVRHGLQLSLIHRLEHEIQFECLAQAPADNEP